MKIKSPFIRLLCHQVPILNWTVMVLVFDCGASNFCRTHSTYLLSLKFRGTFCFFLNWRHHLSIVGLVGADTSANTHSAAGQCRRYQQWRRCGAAFPHGAGLCRLRPHQWSRLAAICRGWPSHRTIPNRSETHAQLKLTPSFKQTFENQEINSTNIDHPHAVSALQVEEDGSFVQMGQHGHVLNHVKLWRVHWLQVIFFHNEKLKNTRLRSPVQLLKDPQVSK